MLKLFGWLFLFLLFLPFLFFGGFLFFIIGMTIGLTILLFKLFLIPFHLLFSLFLLPFRILFHLISFTIKFAVIASFVLFALFAAGCGMLIHLI